MAVNKEIAKDMRTSQDDDLYINSITGDLEISFSDNMHVKDILQSEPGWYKQYPYIGAAIRQMLKGKFNVSRVESIIKEQLLADGYSFYDRPKISINTNGKSIIKPNVERIRF